MECGAGCRYAVDLLVLADLGIGIPACVLLKSKD